KRTCIASCELLLEVKPESNLDLSRIASTARFTEERRSHRTTEAVQLCVVQQILDLHLECHCRSIILLVVQAAVILTAISATKPPHDCPRAVPLPHVARRNRRRAVHQNRLRAAHRNRRHRNRRLHRVAAEGNY